MILISLIFTLGLSIALNIYLLYRTTYLKASAALNNSKLKELELNKNTLEELNIEQLKKIENLSYKSTIQESLITGLNENKNTLLEESKNTILELGNKLGRELLELYQNETKTSRELSEQNIKQTSDKFQTEFIKISNMVSNLDKDISASKNSVEFIKNSLLSPSSFGQLAELTLENILKSSGLKPAIDFIIQYNIMGENDSRLRPDAIVFLPANNVMLIDAKSSKFLLNNQEQELLSKTMNNHLKSLVKKDYAEFTIQELSKKSFKIKNIITVMFLPTEQAIETISNIDQNFLNKSWDLNIFPVGPVGLMNMLSLTKLHISENQMIDNYEKIIVEIKKLISSIKILSGHVDKVRNNINVINSNFQKLEGSFNQNFLTKLNQISELGISDQKIKYLNNVKNIQEKSSQPSLIS